MRKSAQAAFQVSHDGRTVQFGFEAGKSLAYFSLVPIHVERGEVFVRGKTEMQKLSLYPPLAKVKNIRLNLDNPSRPLLNDSELQLERHERVESFAVSRKDFKSLLLGTNRYLRFLEQDGTEKLRIALPGAASLVNLTPNGEGAVAALSDGTIRWYSLRNGAELLSFFPHSDRRKWIAWTPLAPYFCYAAAEEADTLLRKLQNKNLDTAADLLPVQEGKRPEELAQALETLRGEIDVSEEKGLSPITPAGSRQQSGRTISVILPTLSQEKLTASKQSKLYVLALGVNDYAPPIPKLRFAAKDAGDFTETLQKQAGGLYEEVVVKCLTNTSASRKDIFNALDWIRTHTGKNDVAMIFVSGHGTNDQYEYYYYLPADSNPQHLVTTAVPFSAIQKTAALLQGKAIFFIDTCRSGGAMGKKQIDIRRTLSDLAQSNKTIVVFSSSSNEQVSFEEENWNNGAFTKALIEGIDGKAALADGAVTVYSLSLYISKRVQEMTAGKQTPTIAIPTSIPDFAIARVPKQ